MSIPLLDHAFYLSLVNRKNDLYVPKAAVMILRIRVLSNVTQDKPHFRAPVLWKSPWEQLKLTFKKEPLGKKPRRFKSMTKLSLLKYTSEADKVVLYITCEYIVGISFFFELPRVNYHRMYSSQTPVQN